MENHFATCRCPCGQDLQQLGAVDHLLVCPEWKNSSLLYGYAIEQSRSPAGRSMLIYECEALLRLASPKPEIEEEFKVPAKKLPQMQKQPSYDKYVREEEVVSCELCHRKQPDMTNMFFPECCHMMCKSHAIDAIRSQYPIQNYAKCPMDCGYTFSVEEIIDLIGADEFEKLKEKSFQEFISQTGGIVVNCDCGVMSILEPGVPDYAYKDEQGQPISRRAAENMAQFRFRCGNCHKIFCASCKADPYHLGKTCQEHQDFKVAKHCRYCGKVIQSVRPVCSEAACLELYENSCKKILPCGHQCFGTNGETECFPCLEEECAQGGPTIYDYCAICYIDGLGAAPCVKLICGHLLHYHCLNTYLEKRWVGPRITFNFAKCPNCKEWAQVPDNPALTQKMDKILELYDDIRQKGLKRLKFEGMENDPRLNDPNDHYYQKPDIYALDRFAYYECFKCKQPYFGGKKECEENRDRAGYNPQELVCPGCSAICMDGADCKTHGKEFIEFKCKFCCGISAWFCWGTTHFCDPCHTKQNNGDYVSQKKKEDLPQCPGPDLCPLKVRHPPNGEEFSLGCAICRNLASNSREF
ncbi:unnamed protein product [Blepharisma stoltei]|uniref:RING-type domain-containing protein n=1 Tax=Blepharisma stoltei TaxID=1481888 RepID=A0AAU9IE00_9CILI|nr:unnamed protein product [Blepharisma stoltei]